MWQKTDKLARDTKIIFFCPAGLAGFAFYNSGTGWDIALAVKVN